MMPEATDTDFFATELMVAGDVPFDERRPFLLDAARNFLESRREACRERHNAGGSGREIVECITAMADEPAREVSSVVVDLGLATQVH